MTSPSFVGRCTDDAICLLIHGENSSVAAAAQHFDERDRSAEAEAW